MGAEGRRHFLELYIFIVSHHQVDYLQEVREFEAEIQRHAHKYPHDILIIITAIIIIIFPNHAR